MTTNRMAGEMIYFKPGLSSVLISDDVTICDLTQVRNIVSNQQECSESWPDPFK